MGYCDILAKFFTLFPQFMEKVSFWAPGEKKNSVSVDMSDGKKFLFTYWNDSEWNLAAFNAAVRQI